MVIEKKKEKKKKRHTQPISSGPSRFIAVVASAVVCCEPTLVLRPPQSYRMTGPDRLGQWDLDRHPLSLILLAQDLPLCRRLESQLWAWPDSHPFQRERVFTILCTESIATERSRVIAAARGLHPKVLFVSFSSGAPECQRSVVRSGWRGGGVCTAVYPPMSKMIVFEFR